MAAPNHNEMPDVTIELDYDDDLLEDEDVLPEQAEEEDDITIDDPIALSDVTFEFPDGKKIKELANDILVSIFDNLKFPTAVSTPSWPFVYDYLCNQLPNTDAIKNLDRKDAWKPFHELEAQQLLDALEAAQRIDVLFELQMKMRAGDYLQVRRVSRNLSHASTLSIRSEISDVNQPAKKFSGKKRILVLHYERTETEKANFSWFMQNLRRNLRSPAANGLKLLDVATLEKDDGGNMVYKIDAMYNDFVHIVVCFNNSYMTSFDTIDFARDFWLRKWIHEKTKIEFMDNQGRNKRCRCVLMPGTTHVNRLDWASVTTQYKFPDDFNDLFKRLILMRTTTSNTVEMGRKNEIERPGTIDATDTVSAAATS
ncbi:unnamed protein product [Caenorhabditis sp. 36 PRJEB53466]|nr:unnamed protein product [Caenorhabditis sp. 36 PRJEB53466]